MDEKVGVRTRISEPSSSLLGDRRAREARFACRSQVRGLFGFQSSTELDSRMASFLKVEVLLISNNYSFLFKVLVIASLGLLACHHCFYPFFTHKKLSIALRNDCCKQNLKFAY